MKTIKKISLLVLVCSLFAMMILSNSNIQQLGYSNVIKSINYNEGNNSSNITFEEKQVFEGIETTFNSTSIQGSTSVNSSAAPFVYTNLDLFSGKTLTKIGVPVKTVKVLDENQTFTLYVVDKTNVSSGKATTANKTYTLKLPLDQLGSSTTVNNWVYVDLSSYDITVGENETLAFSSSSDTVKWGYKTGGTEEYRFWKTVFTSASLLSSYNIYFDVYYREEKEIELPPAPPETPTQPEESDGLKNKKISILGDSISTYKGWSNNSTDTNSTIGNNSIYYGGSNIIKDVNDTWWMKTINDTGLKLLVNNSYSGDTVAKAKSSRALQLHDDTGDNSGTNPDIIAVYLGINDIKNGGTLDNFTVNYNTMIENIRNKYTDADIFVFTHVPYYYSSNVPTLEDAELEKFNKVIRDVASETENCYVVDLFADSGINSENFKTYMGDAGLHPNVDGMNLISKTFVKKLEDVYLEKDNNNNNENENENENQEEIENPFTSTSLIKIISLILIVGSIILLISTFKNTKINRYE